MNRILFVFVGAAVFSSCGSAEQDEMARLKDEMDQAAEVTEKASSAPQPPTPRHSLPPWSDGQRLAGAVASHYTMHYVMQKKSLVLTDSETGKTFKLKLEKQHADRPYPTGHDVGHVLAEMTSEETGEKVICDFELLWSPQGGVDQRGSFSVGAVTLWQVGDVQRYKYIKQGDYFLRREVAASGTN